MKKRFSEEQIIGFLREVEAGIPAKDLCRKHGFSATSYYLCQIRSSDRKKSMTDNREKARLMILIGHESLKEAETYCMSHNWDIWLDMPTSEEWLTTRSLAGDDRADAALSAILSLGFLGENRRQDALPHAERAAKNNHPEDLLVLAGLLEIYTNEKSRIVPLIEQAAQVGYGRALDKLAHYYAAGWHVEPDPLRSAELMLKAAESGYAPSLYKVGHDLLLSDEGDEVLKGIEYLSRAAEKGDENALYTLATTYKYGLHGIPVDILKAERFLCQHAEITKPYELIQKKLR